MMDTSETRKRTNQDGDCNIDNDFFYCEFWGIVGIHLKTVKLTSVS